MTLQRFLLIISLFIYPAISTGENTDDTPLVTTAWLAENLEDVIVLDIRTSNKTYLSAPEFWPKSSKLAKVGGHIPGAQLILYKHVRGDRVIDGRTIKHMVVTTEKFESLMRNAGVDSNKHIVITTNAESTFDLTMAARMFWQVKYFGHTEVSLLNGGTAQWIIDGHDVSSSTTDKTSKGNWQSGSLNPSIFADSDETSVASQKSDIQLVDVRSLGQYLGSQKSGKAKAKGHIPTAKTYPIELLTSHNLPVKFLTSDELKQLSNALGIDDQQPLITYCNSGHMASGAWFAFHEILGNENTKLYDGSMHQWTHENRPVVSMILE